MQACIAFSMVNMARNMDRGRVSYDRKRQSRATWQPRGGRTSANRLIETSVKVFSCWELDAVSHLKALILNSTARKTKLTKIKNYHFFLLM